MYICVKLFLNVDEALARDLIRYESCFKKEVDRIYRIFIEKGYAYEYPYRYFSRSISYNSKHLLLLCAKQKFNSVEKKKKFSYDFSSYWSNSSYTISEGYLKLELGLDIHRDRLLIPIYKNDKAFLHFEKGSLMNLKLIENNHKWYALIDVEYIPIRCQSNKTMGIDIGMKVPAVTCIDGDRIRFFGNGREIRFMQRKYRAHIKAMQKRNQYKKLIQFEHKLNHVLDDFDHKISKAIIDYACDNNIGIIKMENLMFINRKFKVRYNPNIYLWSYRRLQKYIDYKAKLKGIKVCYINPYHTSQKCPQCGKLNRAKDRKYTCLCGYENHRDAVAAINIRNAL